MRQNYPHWHKLQNLLDPRKCYTEKQVSGIHKYLGIHTPLTTRSWSQIFSHYKLCPVTKIVPIYMTGFLPVTSTEITLICIVNFFAWPRHQKVRPSSFITFKKNNHSILFSFDYKHGHSNLLELSRNESVLRKDRIAEKFILYMTSDIIRKR